MQLKIIVIFIFFVILFLSGNVIAAIHLAPKMLKSPNDMTYEFGSTENTLIWQFEAHESQDHPTTYSVTIDSIGLKNHNNSLWQDKTDIIVKVDGLDLGEHSVQITVHDNGVDEDKAPAAIDEAIVSVVPVGSITSINSSDTSVTKSADQDFPVVSLLISYSVLSNFVKIKKRNRS